MSTYRHTATCLEGPLNRSPDFWSDEGGTALAPADDIRIDLVERVRREIAAGTYDTPERWELALDRLLGDLEGR